MNIKHAVLGVAAACVTAGAVAHAVPARAATIVAVLQNENTKRCIDDSQAYGLRSYPCNGTNYQKWVLGYYGNGNSYRNIATGRCIDDSQAYGLRSFPCNNLAYQDWAVNTPASSTDHYWNRATGRCLDDSFSYGLRSFPCNNLNYQWWYDNATVY